MATDEWGMLRDIFTEVADDNFETANLLLPEAKPLGSGRNPYFEARVTAHFTVAHAFRAVADKMRARGGMTPDELTAGIAALGEERRKRTHDGNDSNG